MDRSKPKYLKYAVIRIWICKFLDLQDPDQLVRGPDPDPSIITQNSKKRLGFYRYCFVTSLWLFIFKE
jgi:hypothetical protein